MYDLESYHLERDYRMKEVEAEAKSLISEYAGEFATAKPEIVSNLKEFALEEAKIRLDNVVVWDNGSIYIEFGTFYERD